MAVSLSICYPSLPIDAVMLRCTRLPPQRNFGHLMGWIDRLLSRFKIRTKVLLLVLPFILSITAVGVTGLVTSGLLQSRMAISSDVAVSLRGFKDVYAAMIGFLDQTTEENRALVFRRLDEQRAALDTARRRLTPQSEGWEGRCHVVSLTRGQGVYL